MSPDLVAPMVAFLAHEECPVSGEIYAAGAGRFARIFLAQAEGYVHAGAPTVEDIAAHWAEINDEAGYTVPADLMGWSAEFMAHLPEPFWRTPCATTAHTDAKTASGSRRSRSSRLRTLPDGLRGSASMNTTAAAP